MLGSQQVAVGQDLASSALTRLLVAAVRVLVALLWIENLSWTRPPEFGHGSNPPEGLYQWTLYGVQNEMFGPWAWLVDMVVLPNFVVFAWVTFMVEVCLGAFLLVGLATRFWALMGIGQTLAIIFSVLRTPHEWFWAYLMRRELDRYAVGLGLGAVASLVLGVADRTPLRLIAVGAGAVLATLILAAIAIAGGYLGMRVLASVAGVGFLVAAVLQVVQMSIGESNALGGDGSTVGLFFGFDIGLLAVGSTRSPNLEEDGDGSQ